MKKLIVLLTLITSFSGCDKEEIIDPFAGTWVYNDNGYNVEFQVTTKGNSYQLNGITVNSTAWENFELKTVSKGKSIGKVIIRKAAFEPDATKVEGMVFIDCKLAADGTMIMVDSVVYQKFTDQTFYFNQVIEKK